MIPSRMWFSAPAAGGRFGAFEGLVAKLVTVEAMSRRFETKASLKWVVGREGREAWLLGKLLSLGASNGEDNSGGKCNDHSSCRVDRVPIDFHEYICVDT